MTMDKFSVCQIEWCRCPDPHVHVYENGRIVEGVYMLVAVAKTGCVHPDLHRKGNLVDGLYYQCEDCKRTFRVQIKQNAVKSDLW